MKSDNIGQVVLGTSVAWLVGTVFIKLAILQLYKRIFDTATFRKLAWSLMVLSVLYGITFVVLFITHCIPVDQSWNPRPWGKCRDITSEQVTSGSLNIVIDTAIIILPMPWLWKLQMPLRNKVFLSILFTLGLV
jgi:hypothetical protein